MLAFRLLTAQVTAAGNDCNWHAQLLKLLGQGRNHVFKVEGPIPWSRVLLPSYRKKLDRSTQFSAVGYIITLYSSKSYVKSWGFVQILGRSGPRPPSGCAHVHGSSLLQTLAEWWCRVIICTIVSQESTKYVKLWPRYCHCTQGVQGSCWLGSGFMCNGIK